METEPYKMLKNMLYIYITLISLFYFSNVQASEDICSCVSEPIVTDAKAKSCGKLLDDLTPEETVRISGECNAKLINKTGLNVCTCLTTFQTDPDIIKACEDIVGKNTRPSELVRLAENCH